MEIYFVTSNKNKLSEVRAMLGREIEGKSVEIDEIQDVDAARVVQDKARRAYSIVKAPVIVEDSGLYLEAMSGFPGALVKWVEKTVGEEGICRMLDPYKNRKAFAETCLGYFDGDRFRLFKGRVNGTIADMPRGTDGFGWDNIFIPESYDKTFAEMGVAKKNTMSHRSRAALKLKAYLDSIDRAH
jgi:XTP/dITP diphosphohydrolase